MGIDYDTLHLLIIVGTVLFGNYVGVKVMQVQMKGIVEKIQTHEIQIQELYNRTRYVMSGHQVRESIREEVVVTHEDIRELQITCNDIQREIAVIKTQLNNGGNNAS